jgi:hypothetical protein
MLAACPCTARCIRCANKLTAELAYRAISASGRRAFVMRMSLHKQGACQPLFQALQFALAAAHHANACLSEATRQHTRAAVAGQTAATQHLQTAIQATASTALQMTFSIWHVLADSTGSECKFSQAHHMHCPGFGIGQRCRCHQSPPDAEMCHSAMPSHSLVLFHLDCHQVNFFDPVLHALFVHWHTLQGYDAWQDSPRQHPVRGHSVCC